MKKLIGFQSKKETSRRGFMRSVNTDHFGSSFWSHLTLCVPGATHINFLPTTSTHHQEEAGWELIKLSRENALIFYQIDLFSSYILFPHFRPRVDHAFHQGNFPLLLFINYVYICTWTGRGQFSEVLLRGPKREIKACRDENVYSVQWFYKKEVWRSAREICKWILGLKGFH